MTEMNGTERMTAAGRPISWYVDQEVRDGRWREEEVEASVVGLTRPLTIFRGVRKTGFIAYDWHGDKSTFCPPMWWDLAIGSGACGLGCRACIDQDTWIYTDVGPVRVQELCTRFQERPWKVLGYDENFRATWTPLLAIASKPDPGNHLAIKLDTGHRVQVTPDHPMIVARAGHFEGWDGSLPAQRVVSGDWLPVAQKVPALERMQSLLDLLTIDWGIPIWVEDETLAARLPVAPAEIAKQIGQLPQADRRYLFTRHAQSNSYGLQEYLDVLRVTGLSPGKQVRVRAMNGHSSPLAVRSFIAISALFWATT